MNTISRVYFGGVIQIEEKLNKAGFKFTAQDTMSNGFWGTKITVEVRKNSKKEKILFELLN